MQNPNLVVKPARYVTDSAFDWLYPERIQQLSKRHWTPMSVARKSAQFLANSPGKKVLDIGSGVGKFCILGGISFPQVNFYGVEQREELYHLSLEAKEVANVQNVDFIHANFTKIDLDAYDNYYFYNSFFENIDDGDKIDNAVECSANLYVYYSRFLYRALEKKCSGTRLVTFHSLENEVPPSYQVVDVSPDFQLKMWIKR
ncbi:methyltransferase [Chitinophaga sp. SYP-B3965]|nr:methyltransferase [Chitinophaga sp. SYP-B3965]